MKTKKILFSLAALALSLSMTACGGLFGDNDTEEPSGENTDGQTVTEQQGTEATDAIDIIKNGEVAEVIYPISADSEVIGLANSLIGNLKKISGASGLRPKSDGADYDEDKVQILIGNTCYPESQQVYADIGYGEGLVCVVGNKIIVAGYDATACSKALNSLVVALSTNRDEDGNVSLKKNFLASVSDRPLVAALPVFDGEGEPRTENAGQGSARLVFEGVKEADVKAYASKLEGAGYVKYDENKIDSNLYYTFYNSNSVVTVIYVERSTSKDMSVTVDSRANTALAPLEADNRYNAITTTTFTQLGLYYDDNKEANEAALDMQNMNGLCYVMRLADGRFIIIDGGHATEGHADRLYELLKKQAVDQNDITVAAWIFTHDHGDHVGFFSFFTSKYASAVTVERFVHSFPFTSANGVVSNMSSKYKDAEIIKSHAGQKLYIANATVEILYTTDIYNGNVENIADTNMASQVFSITVDGTKFMFFGDYYDFEKTVLDIYSKQTLKADVMQVPHHGIYGSSNTVNTTVEPTYAFWPVAMLDADNAGGGKKGHVYWKEPGRDVDVDLLGRSDNHYFVKVMDYENNVYVANDDVFVATFKDGTLNVVRYEDISAYLSGTAAD